MKYLLGFSVLKEDPERNHKLVVGTALAFSAAVIPILGQVVLAGWQALAMRKAAKGDYSRLPRLDFDFNYLVKLFEVGFKAFIVRFIWQIPLAVVLGTAWTCVFAGAFVWAGNADMADDEVGLVVTAMVAGSMLVLVPISLVLSIPSAVAGMRTELTNDLNEGLKFREVLDFTKKNFRPLLVGTLVLGLVTTALAFVGLAACYVGIFPVIFAATAAHAYLMGQVYQHHVANGGEPLSIGEDEIVLEGSDG